ncbi:secreted salivary gland peptide, putative, partial [Ixodes scapularis]
GSGNLFDLKDAVYSYLVTNCSNSERLVTFDITGDNKTRGLKAGETMDTYVMLYFCFHRQNRKTLKKIKKSSQKFVLVFSQVNPGFADSNAYISEEVEHEDEYMWTVTKGVEFTTTVKFSVNIPLVYQFSSELSTSLKTTSGSTTVETRTTRQSITQDVIIPPGTTIEAKWYVNEARVVVPWESDIYMEGTVAALFETPNRALTWKYFNVTEIKHKDLQINGTSVRFRASGLFKANVAQSYHLSTTQKKLTHRTARLAKYIFEQES